MRKPGRLPYVVETKPGYLYFRKGGKYLQRLTAPEGTQEFHRQYWEVRSGKPQKVKQSWAAAFRILRESDRWAEKSIRYRRDLDRVLDYLEAKIGGKAVARLTQADIYDAMDANKHRVRFANYIPVAISMAAKEIIRRRWITENPANRVEQLKVPEHRKQPHIPWPDWAVERFRAEAQPFARLIFEIGVGTVQRPGDWPGFTWGDYDGDTLRLRQNKTGKALVIPCTAQLKATLDAARAALPVEPLPSRPILVKRDGNPMGSRYLADVMMRERKRLGLEAYDLHALRYRGVRELAWAGCNDDEIASYSGHATKAMIAKYAGEARQEMRARQAREKRK